MIPDLAAIHPRNGAKYSPNLHRFLSMRRSEMYRRHGKVYKDPDGVLWLGVFDEPYLLGARLMTVLCNGAKAKVFAHHAPAGLVEVPDFWQTYMEVGRCAIDPAHEMFFAGDESRWSVDGDTRMCLWCGSCRQHREQYVVKLSRERWVPMSAPTAAAQ